MLTSIARQSSRTLCRTRQAPLSIRSVPAVQQTLHRVGASVVASAQPARAFSQTPSTVRAPEASATETLNEQNQTQQFMRVGERIPDVRPATRKIDILFLTNAHNSMSQRAYLELTAMGHDVTVELALSEQQMIDVVEKHNPELIVGPFLTKYVNEAIWKKYPTLIVHPGIHGDRGASAIDWALQTGRPEWGVTVLSAAEEMDAGDIWSSVNFQVERNLKTGVITKSSMYGTECINAGMVALKEALHKYLHEIPPTPLDYSDPACEGTLMPNMKQKDRAVDWTLGCEDIVQKIAAADGQPGVLDKIAGQNVFIFGAHVEKNLNADGKFAPRTLIAKRDEAVCVATGNNGAVWITHMKQKNAGGKKFLKLPATRALADVPEVEVLPELTTNLMEPHDPKDTWKEIWTETDAHGVCYLHFDMYNGAMNTQQCQRVTAAIKEIKSNPEIKVLVLMGGYNYFSNGIHLNTIEASADPINESWENINAINDIVLEVMDSPELMTISAIRGKAGAGGVMMALGADTVYTHESTILNPHYRSMGLFGSEYWTHNLPARVGQEMAKQITESCQPISGKKAASIKLVDGCLGGNVEEFDSNVRLQAEVLARRSDFSRILADKKQKLTKEWRATISRSRRGELSKMRDNFRDPVYVSARKNFVYKKAPLSTPQHLVKTKGLGKIMDGKLLSKMKRQEMKATIAQYKEEHNDQPGLTVLIVRGDKPSELYVKMKQKWATQCGFNTVVEFFEPDTPNLAEVMAKRVDELNVDDSMDGIMVQLPLPTGVDHTKVVTRIDVKKDVDALNPHHMGVMCTNFHETDSYFTPCTAKGIIELIHGYDIKIAGKKVVVVGASQVVGLPVALALMKQHATVQICHQHTQELEQHIREANIIVSATGATHLIKSDWVQEGTVVIDAGISVIKNAKGESYVTGDVEKEVSKKASFITPVPGGVGPMTVTMLLKNTMESFARKIKAKQIAVRAKVEAVGDRNIARAERTVAKAEAMVEKAMNSPTLGGLKSTAKAEKVVTKANTFVEKVKARRASRIEQREARESASAVPDTA